MTLGLVAAFAACLLYGVASVVQAVGARRPSAHFGALGHPLVWMGLALDGVAFLVSLVAYGRLALVVAQAIIAAAVVVTVLVAPLVLPTRLRRSDVVAVSAAAIGLAFTAAGSTQNDHAGISASLTVGLITISVLLALVLALSYSRGGPVWLALLAGCGYAVVAVAARGIDASSSLWQLVAQPVLIAVVVGGGVGVAGFVRSLEAGRVGTSMAIVSVIEVVIPSTVGLIALGDHFRPGWLGVGGVAGAVVALVAAVLLGYSPAARAAAEVEPALRTNSRG